MNEKKAKKNLRKMLRKFPGGALLMLLGEIHEEWAEEARRAGDESGWKLLHEAACALLVFGAGLDTTCPRE